MLQPKRREQLDSGIKELLANGADNAAVEQYAKDFTSKFGNEGAEVKKKVQDSGSISAPVKSVSGTGIGSSATSDVNPFKSTGIPGQLPAVDMSVKPAKTAPVKSKVKAAAQTQERGLGEKLLSKVETGSAGLGASMASIPDLAYDVFSMPQNAIADMFDIPSLHTDSKKHKAFGGLQNHVKEYYQNQVSGLREKAKLVDKQYEQGVYDSFANGDIKGGFDQLSSSFAESLPATTSIMLGGAFTKLPQLLAANTMLFGAGKNEELKKDNPNMNSNARTANALATGFAEGAFETLGSGSIGAAAKALVQREGAKKGLTILKDGLQSFAKEAIKKNPLMAGMATEGLEEWGTQVAQNSIDVATGVKPADYNVFTGGADALIGGAFGGGVFGGGMKGIQQVVNHKDRQTVKNNTKAIFSLQNELNNPEVSETTKAEINKNIDNLVKHNQALVQKSSENIESLHPDVKEKLIESISTIETLKEKAQAIKDDNSSPETKKVLLANLKQEAKEANKIKDKILKGEATVIDALSTDEQDKIKRKAWGEIQKELPEGIDSSNITDKQLDELFSDDKILAKAVEIYENEKPAKPKIEFKPLEPDAAETTTEAALPPAPENYDIVSEPITPVADVVLEPINLSTEPQITTNETTSRNDSSIDGNIQPGTSELGENTVAGEEVIEPKSTQPAAIVGEDQASPEVKAEIEHNGTVFSKTIDGDWLNTKTGNTIKGISDKGKALIKTLNEKLGGNLSDLDHAKKEIERGVLNWDGDTGNERVVLGITWADIRKGEKDIKAGKVNTAPAKKLIEALREAKERGGYQYVQGSGGIQSKQFIPLSEVQRASNENNLTDEEQAIINNNEDRLAKEFDKYFNSLDEDSQNAILDNYENTTENKSGKTSRDAKIGESKNDVSDSEESGKQEAEEEVAKEEKPEAKEPAKEPVKEEKTEAKGESKESKDDFEKKKGKRSISKRASEGEFTTVKNAIKRHSLDYDVENQEKAKENADAFVEELKKEFGFEDGINSALNAVRSGQITGAEKAFVYDKVIRDVNQEIENAIGEERADLEELNTEILGEVMDEFAKEGTKAGQFISALGKIYTGSMGMYNLTKRVADYKAANNGVISDEVLKKFTEADAKIKELEAKLDEMQKEKVRLEEEQSLKDIIEEVARQAKVRKTAQIKSTAKAQAFADKLRSFKTTSLGGAMAATPVSLAYDAAIEIAARTIETSGKIADAISEGIAYIRKQKLGKQEEQQVIGQFVNAFSQSEGEQKPITIGDDGKLKIPHSIIRGHVENGIDTVEDLVEAVQNDVNEMFPDNDFTEREVRDAITRYGKTINPTTDEIEQEIGRMNSLGRLISATEDALGGQRPLKSGLQRREVTKEERKMQRELKELLRDLPMDDADLAKTWKTALDSIKTRLANEIEQLDDQIAAGEKRKAERKTIELDDEAKGLKEIRDAKRKELDELVGKPELTYEEKVAKAIKNTEDAVVKLQEKIASGDLAYKNKPTPVTSDKLESLRAQKKALEAQINEMRQDSGLAEMKRLQTAKQARLNRIKELKRRIQEKDFSTKKPKPLPVDAEILEIERQLLEQKAIFDKEKYKQELNDQHVFKKWWDRVGNVLGLPRLLKAGGEFSAVLMQMGFLTTEMLVKNPKAVFKGISMLGKAFTSNTTAQKYETMVKTHPLYPLMQKAKLTLTGTDHRIDATEEAFQLDLVNDTWNQIGEGLNRVTGNKEVLTPLGKLKSLLGKEVTADDRKMAGEQFKDSNLWKMFERGAVTYSNYVKVMKFEEGAKELMKQGYDPINDFEQYKQLAKYINIFSGRANLGRAEMVSKDLAVVFFSARMAVSQFQQLNPLFYAGLADWSNVKGITSLNKVKSTVAQKMAVKSFITSFATITGFSLAFMAAANAASDDDEEKWTIETDPRSSDFGKLRKGKFTFDMWHGLGTWAVFFARTLSQQTKKRDSGEISDLGVGRTDAYGDLGVKFVGNKLAPTASYLWQLMLTHPEVDPNTGETYRVDKYGNVFGDDETMDLLKPIYANAVSNIAKEDPDAWQIFLTAIGEFGANVGVDQEEVKFKDITGGMPTMPSMPKMPKFPETK